MGLVLHRGEWYIGSGGEFEYDKVGWESHRYWADFHAYRDARTPSRRDLSVNTVILSHIHTYGTTGGRKCVVGYLLYLPTKEEVRGGRAHLLRCAKKKLERFDYVYPKQRRH